MSPDNNKKFEGGKYWKVVQFYWNLSNKLTFKQLCTLIHSKLKLKCSEWNLQNNCLDLHGFHLCVV